ncbi:GHKL domain-containing protein [Paenibacillus doosanensis]|uniref:Sensory histidine kinase DcuS n=1 Tax=Paenibacillus konkukensis TaxID=2020716 RepID=A0ABY4RK08_9BACL|nr:MULTISPECIES: GHKL domain-containing protein [Paenibacillus]MCS7462729.1 GHKL domain-containing protein [Paenibacillus doosanensis]UQZ82355.1 sensory histidine kinase DcuS [Paenibacillus konkukensis]
MLTKKRFLSIFILSVILILLLNHVTYYFSTKKLLTENQMLQNEAIAKQISMSIEQAQSGSQYLMDTMTSQLRTAALVIKDRLSPDIADVTDEQLLQLRDEIGLISGITLFERKPDGDIVGARSTDPKERGISTRSWGSWFKAFNQLFDEKKVTGDKYDGIKLPNYWSGPLEIATSDPTRIGAWGYYYDGSTNYLIDPWLQNSSIQEYENITGPSALLKHTMESNKQVLEITIFNPDKVGREVARGLNANNEQWVKLVDRQIMYGDYSYIDSDHDFANVVGSAQSDTPVSTTAQINGKHVLKTFVPMKDAKIPYVVSIVSDYDSIHQQLNKQLVNLLYVLLVTTLIILALVYLVARWIHKAKDDATRSAQESFIDQINSMFITIKGQRHDFLNHLSTLHALVQMKKYNEIKTYSEEYLGEIIEINDIINIGNPAIGALIQSKIAKSMPLHIHFQYEIEGMQELALGVKSVDIVKIIGNLIDNGMMSIEVANPLSQSIAEHEVPLLFKEGHSTKQKTGHSGLGLAIIRELVKKYKGHIHCDAQSEAAVIRFKVLLPIEKHRKEAG